MAELVYALVSGASRATGVGSTPIQCTIYALVAQLDRVQPSEGWGQAFESPRARHLDKSDLDSSRSFLKNVFWLICSFVSIGVKWCHVDINSV